MSNVVTPTTDLLDQFIKFGQAQNDATIKQILLQTQWQMEANIAKASSDMAIAPTKVAQSMASDYVDSIR